MSGAGSFGGTGKSGEPAPGFLSPFDINAATQGAGQSMEAMANRYAQLGMSGVGATPGSAGGEAGGIGVGNIGQNINFQNIPGNMARGGIQFPASMGQGTNFPGTSPGAGGPGGGGITDIFGGNTGGSPGGGGGAFLSGSPGGGGVNFNPSQAPTAELMDLGYAPSLTGGIPNEFAAMLGELQTQDIAATAGMSQGGSGGGKGGGGKGGMGSIMSLAMMGGK